MPHERTLSIAGRFKHCELRVRGLLSHPHEWPGEGKRVFPLTRPMNRPVKCTRAWHGSSGGGSPAEARFLVAPSAPHGCARCGKVYVCRRRQRRPFGVCKRTL